MSEPEEESGPALLPAELAIDRVEVTLTVGIWRGRLKVGAIESREPLLLFAKDDGARLPWGRALEELLAAVLERIAAESQGESK